MNHDEHLTRNPNFATRKPETVEKGQYTGPKHKQKYAKNKKLNIKQFPTVTDLWEDPQQSP